jgi:hypothetical protein
VSEDLPRAVLRRGRWRCCACGWPLAGWDGDFSTLGPGWIQSHADWTWRKSQWAYRRELEGRAPAYRRRPPLIGDELYGPARPDDPRLETLLEGPVRIVCPRCKRLQEIAPEPD